MRGWILAFLFGALILLVIGLSFAGAVSDVAPTPVADAPGKSPAICFTVESLQTALAEKAEEALVFTGRMANGQATILFAGTGGNWTLAQLFASGAACLVAVGDGARLPKGIVIVPRRGERPA